MDKFDGNLVRSDNPSIVYKAHLAKSPGRSDGRMTGFIVEKDDGVRKRVIVFPNGDSQTDEQLSGVMIRQGSSNKEYVRGMMTNVGGTPDPAIYKWNFRNSLTDTVQGLVSNTNANRTAAGVEILSANKYLELPEIFEADRTYWLKFGDFNVRKGGGGGDNNGRVLCVSNSNDTTHNGSCFVYRSNGTISFYLRTSGGWQNVSISSVGEYNAFQNQWLKMYSTNSQIVIYKGEEVFLSINKPWGHPSGYSIVVGGTASDIVCDVVIEEAKVYQGLYI